jgi:F-box domain
VHGSIEYVLYVAQSTLYLYARYKYCMCLYTIRVYAQVQYCLCILHRYNILNSVTVSGQANRKFETCAFNHPTLARFSECLRYHGGKPCHLLPLAAPLPSYVSCSRYLDKLSFSSCIPIGMPKHAREEDGEEHSSKRVALIDRLSCLSDELLLRIFSYLPVSSLTRCQR